MEFMRSAEEKNEDGSLVRALLRSAIPLLCLALPFHDCLAQSQPTCASVATSDSVTWNTVFSPGGTWALSLAQDLDGTISGTATYVSSACKDTPQSVSGTANGDGTFALAVTDPSGTCGETDFTVTLSGPGCAQATGTYTDHSGLGSTGTVKMTDGAGVLPSGETPSAFLFLETPTTAEFTMNLVPTDYNFQGRAVTETFPAGLDDGCLSNPGSPVIPNPPPITVYPLVNGPGGNPLGTPVNGVTTGYEDQVGLVEAEVNQIRAVGDAPCTLTAVQHMWIDTSSQYDDYQDNTMTITVGTTTMTAQRGGAPPKTWPYLTPSQTRMPAIIVPYIMHKSQ